MSGGFGTGFLAGTLLAVALAVLAAIVAPLPPPDPVENAQTEFNPPAGSGFTAGGIDTEPALPAQDSDAGADAAADLPVATTAPAPSVEVDTAPADRPQAVAEVEQPRAEPVVIDVATEIPKPTAPDRPSVSAAPGLDTPAAPDRPSVAEPTAPLPAVEPPVTEIAEPEPSPALPSPTLPAPTLPVVPDTVPEAGDAPAQPVADSETPAAPSAEPAGDETTTVAIADDPVADTPVDDGETGETETAPVTVPEPPALIAHAATPVPLAGRAALAVILVDTGLPVADLLALSDLAGEVTIGIDPARPDAAAKLDALRAAGMEAVLLAPEGLAADTAEATIGGLLATHERVVGLLDRPSARIQSETALAQAILPRLERGGFGFVPYDIGLNTVLRAAAQLGVAAYPAFRDLDADRENAATIGRYLNRAALKARQDGQVIMVGHTYPDTIEAVRAFRNGGRIGEIALVPVSVILQARMAAQ